MNSIYAQTKQKKNRHVALSNETNQITKANYSADCSLV